MALWQFEAEVVPSERIQGRSEISLGDFERALWWTDRQPPQDFRDRLATLLPPAKSWHEQVLWYGDEDGDRFDVCLENEQIESFHARLDCRKVNVQLVERLLQLAKDWSCSFVETRYRRVLPMSLREFVQSMLDSPNHRFMEDPAYWLPKLAAEVEAMEAGESS